MLNLFGIHNKMSLLISRLHKADGKCWQGGRGVGTLRECWLARKLGQTFGYSSQQIILLGLYLQEFFYLCMSYKNVHCSTVCNSQK